MAIEVKRKERESTAAFLRRFTRRIQQSGVLIQSRRTRFYKSPKTKRQKKLEALHRITRQKELERLKKLGKLEIRQFIHRRWT